MMIRAIIIDDEEDARFLLTSHLSKHFAGSITIEGQADSVKTGIKLIKQIKPDLVFLDIQMGDGTGFDLLKQLPDKNFELVFVTAYNQYALKAFQFSAMGYLMKPIKSIELINAVNNIIQHFSNYRNETEKRLKILNENYGDDYKIKKIVIPSAKGFEVIDLNHIIRLEGDRNYTIFITTIRSKISSTKTLGEYEKLLTEYGFFRVHKSTLVNLRHIISYTKEHGGIVKLINGDEVQISRHRKGEFIKRFI